MSENKKDTIENQQTPQNELPPLPPDPLADMIVPITVICFIAFAAAAVFTTIDIRVSGVIMGVLLTLVGIVAIKTIKITEKTWEIVILPLIGVPLMIIPLYLLLSEHFPQTFPPVSDNGKTIITGALAIAGGILFILFSIAQRVMIKKRCTEEVSAVCVDYAKGRSRGIETFMSIWEYTFEGEQIKSGDNIFNLKRTPPIGTQQTIWVNPHDPKEFYRRESLGYIMFVVIGIALIFAGCIIFFSVIG